MLGVEDVFLGFSAHAVAQVLCLWHIFTPTFCTDIFVDAFRCSARETSKSRVGEQDTESVKNRWLTFDFFTAL